MTSLFPYGGESLTQKKMANGNILFHPVKRRFILIPISAKEPEQKSGIRDSSKPIFFNLRLKVDKLSPFSRSSPEIGRNKPNTFFRQESGEF
jgi:hypothetical protein